MPCIEGGGKWRRRKPRSPQSSSAPSIAICAPPTPGKIIYVDGDAIGAGNGTSWRDAYKFLQDGLAAAEAGDEVRVAQGVYKPDRSAANPEGSRDRAATFRMFVLA